VCEATSIIR